MYLGKYFKKNLFQFLVFVVLVIPLFAFAGNPASPIEPGDNIQDPGDPGTAWGGCGPSDSNCYVTIDTATFFTQDGNSFAGSATLGTNDANALIFETSEASVHGSYLLEILA